MMRRVDPALVVAILWGLLGIPAGALAQDPVYQELESRTDQIVHQVQHQTGLTVGDVFIRPDSGREGVYRVTLFDHRYVYRAEVEISEVDLENMDEKVDEVITVIASDLKDKKEQLIVGEAFLEDLIDTDEWSPGFSNGFGAVAGAPFYTSIWVQLPGISAGEADVLGVHGNGSWLRTSIGFEGTADGPEGQRVLLGRVTTSIWEMEQRAERERRVIRIGTIEGRVRTDDLPDSDPMIRLDADLVRVTHGQSYPAGKYLEYFYNTSVRFGLRLVEESQGTFRFVLGKTLQLGLMIADRFFISGRLYSELDYQTNSLLTFGMEAGWRISDRISIKAGATYRMEHVVDYGRDDMYLLPDGWSFNAGFFARF